MHLELKHPSSFTSQMEKPICKFMICLVALLLVLGFGSKVEAATVCGKSTPDQEAMKLAPCAMAAQDAKASVSGSCCAQVKSIGQSPSCLCAVLLSDMAKASGVKPEIAITIPKRCNLADRPVGYKCGCEFFTTPNLYYQFVYNETLVVIRKLLV